MKTADARGLLKKHCRHREEWRCGQAVIRITGRDSNPRFDRRMDIVLSQTPAEVNVEKIARLLRFLERLGHNKRQPKD